MSDHKDAAELWIEDAIRALSSRDDQVAVIYATMATAQATLYLAEQQRIANLIAYGHLRTDILNGEPALPSLRKQWQPAHRQIVEGLGLS